MRKPKKQTPVEVLYGKFFDHVQVNMMAIPKIYKDIEEVIQQAGGQLVGADVDEKMKALVEKYRA